MAKPSLHDTMRNSFHELTAKRDAILAVSTPLREKYDAIRAEISQIEADKLKPVEAEMKAVEEGLFEVNQEISSIVAFLKRGGQFAETGDAPAAKY